MANPNVTTAKPAQHDPLDDALSDSFPASDPVAAESPTIPGEPNAVGQRLEPDPRPRGRPARSRKA